MRAPDWARRRRAGQDVYPLHRWSLLGRSRYTRWLLGPFVRPDRPYAVRVDRAGVTELLVGGEARPHPWSTIRDVEYLQGRIRLVTEHETVEWRCGLMACSRLLLAIVCRLHPEPEPETRIEPETIAVWLGIPVDGQLVVRDGRWLGWLMVIGAIIVSGFVVREALSAGEWWNVLVWLVVFAQTPFHWRHSRHIVATPHGLRHGGELVPWSEVNQLSRSMDHTAYTRQGRRIELGNGRRARRVGDTIVEILEARKAGAGPARMDDVPESALSRAEAAEVSIERGISRTAGPPR